MNEPRHHVRAMRARGRRQLLCCRVLLTQWWERPQNRWLLSVFCLLLLVSGWSGWLRQRVQFRVHQEHIEQQWSIEFYQQTLRELGNATMPSRCTSTTLQTLK